MTYALTASIREAVRADSRRIVITGAGGWLGLATLELLADALGDDLAARVQCYGASRRSLALLCGKTVVQEPLEELAELDKRPTLLLHLAFLTKDRAEWMTEADYRAANRGLTEIVLDNLAAIGTEAAFVASSGAARFAADPAKSTAMRLYGELKRADEVAFAKWAEEGGGRAVIARLFNISGPHINKVKSYALSALLLEALAGRPIAVSAPHRVVRGYVAIRELMSLVFGLLLNGSDPVTRFDTAGVPMELEAVAELIATLFDGTAVRATITTDAEDAYLGEGTGYNKLLDRRAIDRVSFEQQLIETANYLATHQTIAPTTGSEGGSRL